MKKRVVKYTPYTESDREWIVQQFDTMRLLSQSLEGPYDKRLKPRTPDISSTSIKQALNRFLSDVVSYKGYSKVKTRQFLNRYKAFAILAANGVSNASTWPEDEVASCKLQGLLPHMVELVMSTNPWPTHEVPIHDDYYIDKKLDLAQSIKNHPNTYKEGK